MDYKLFQKSNKAKTLTYFAKYNNVAIDSQLLSDLKNISTRNQKENTRICLHSTPEDTFHDMIILEYRGKRYYRPHKHKQKSETIHLMEGKAKVIIFDTNGNINQAIELSMGGICIFRIATNFFHTIIPLTEYVIYHESKLGPFEGGTDSIYPDWAPNEQNANLAADYLLKLCAKDA